MSHIHNIHEYIHTYIYINIQTGRRPSDGGGVRCGDHLPPHKYTRNTPTCGTTPTEHLLNAGRRSKTSQKARNYPCIWGAKEKRKNRDKRIGMGLALLGGSHEGGNVSTH